MPASFLFALAAVTATPAADLPVLEKDPTAMSQSEIRAFNKGRSSRDPEYIRCQREDVTGSLARKLLTCHTVKQWAELGRIGNQNARDFVEATASSATNNQN